MILFVFGTRPEAIKLAPLIHKTRLQNLPHKVCITSQHRELLRPLLDLFGIEPDYDLDVMREEQDLFHITTEVLSKISGVLRELEPSLVVVQGDTTTTLTAALAAQYERIPVAHVEAGLRSGTLRDPHPEEMNRRLTDHVSELLFAPTTSAEQNLLDEGIEKEKIIVTGNTIVDALEMIRADKRYCQLGRVVDLSEDRRLILLTVHRRENFGERLRGILSAIRTLVESTPDIEVVFPVHPNPKIKSVVNAEVNRLERVRLLPPLQYLEFLKLMERSDLILTDSGGLQEEAPSFGRHVLVLRERTERPEGIEAGIAKLIGTDPQTIVTEVRDFFERRLGDKTRAIDHNPYGDGRACERIVSTLIDHFSN